MMWEFCCSFFRVSQSYTDEKQDFDVALTTFQKTSELLGVFRPRLRTATAELEQSRRYH